MLNIHSQVTGGKADRIDWASLEIPEWLSDRLERLGFKFPTEVQRRAAAVLLAGCDAAIQSETGSGKTFSFLVPTLARMLYAPDIFPDDLLGPQAVIVVPTMELGVQVRSNTKASPLIKLSLFSAGLLAGIQAPGRKHQPRQTGGFG